MAVIIGFDDFELDGKSFELRRAGRRVDVQPKVLRVLLYLVEHRDRSVTADELLAALWPNERVTHASVKRAIGGARRALGENSERSARIRTLPRHGYRFDCAVRVLDEKPAAEPRPQVTCSPSPWVGRASVRQQLQHCITDLAHGVGRGVVVAGEPGAGKTRALSELGQLAAGSGVRAWFGRCMHADGAPALWPLVQMLRTGGQELPQRFLAEAVGEGAADIVHALPELQRVLPSLPTPADIGAAAARFRLFDSLAGFLRRLARDRPLALVFDDLQLADSMTLGLLSLLAHQQEPVPLLIACGVRPLVEGDARLQPLAALLRWPFFRVIDLVGFTADEVGRWVQARAGFAIGSELARDLQVQTGGNPLLLEHMLEDIRALPAGQRARAQAGSYRPERFRRPIERHLEQLSERGLVVLRCASVVEEGFTATQLAQLCGQSVETVTGELLIAGQLGLVRPVVPGVEPGEHVFSHALTRAALYAQLPLDERARLHGHAARLCEAQQPRSRAQLARLAEHYLRAGSAHDAGRALPTCMLVARAARERGAFEEAVAYYERALSVAARGDEHAVLRIECMIENGEAAAQAGQLERSRASLLAASAAARAIGETDLVLRAAMALGELPESGTVDTPCVDEIKAAVELVAGDDPRRVCLSALLSKRLSYGRDRETCTRLARAAMRDSEHLACPDLQARTLVACLSGLVDPACRADRLAAGARLERHGHEHGAAASLIHAARARVQAAVEAGDLGAAAAAIETLESVATRARDPIARWRASSYRAMIALLRGQLPAAARHAQGLLARPALARRQRATCLCHAAEQRTAAAGAVWTRRARGPAHHVDASPHCWLASGAVNARR